MRSGLAMLKKHTFLVLSFVAVLVGLGMVGYVLSHSVPSVYAFIPFSSKNDPLLVLWRMCFYAALFGLWQPFLVRWACKAAVPTNTRSFRKRVAYRYRILTMCVVYELFFVQNALSFLFVGR